VDVVSQQIIDIINQLTVLKYVATQPEALGVLANIEEHLETLRVLYSNQLIF
jgi:hypothetical protein